MSTVQRWLSTIGDATIADHPPLAVLAGWIAVLSGDAGQAERWASIVDAASFDLDRIRRLGIVRFGTGHVEVVHVSAGAEQTLADARLAVAQEPAWSAWRDTAVGTLGLALLLTDDVGRGRTLSSSRRLRWPRRLGNTDTLAIARPSSRSSPWIGLIGLRPPDTWSARSRRSKSSGMHDYATSLLAFAAAARLAVHRGDSNEAERQLTRAMRARPSCTFAMPYFAVRARLQLAKVYWSIGEHSTARHLLHEIDDILRAGRPWACSPTQVAEFATDRSPRTLHRAEPVAIAAQPRRAAASPIPADASHVPRHRGAALRLPQHGQLTGRLDLPQARRLVTTPRPWSRRQSTAGLIGG